MPTTVPQAIAQLEGQGLVKRGKRKNTTKAIEHVSELLGCVLPRDLRALYEENLHSVGPALAVTPLWNDHVGARTDDNLIRCLLPAEAAPVFWDGSGNLYGLDLTAGFGTPAVYFFDRSDGFARPHWAAGSSLGAFLMILGASDRAWAEKWPARWELQIDPEIESCPRAPAIWNAG